jgi:hypothetical protein
VKEPVVVPLPPGAQDALTAQDAEVAQEAVPASLEADTAQDAEVAQEAVPANSDVEIRFPDTVKLPLIIVSPINPLPNAMSFYIL